MHRVLRDFSGFFLDLVETVVIGASLFFVIYLFFMQPHQVNGQSMVPNFQNGDYVLTDKISYKLGTPTRGDIVVFHAPPAANCPQGTGCDFIKRVIGLPGETIEVRDNHLFVNNEQVPEEYIPSDFLTEPGAFTNGRTVTLTQNEYFVVGDNRQHSSDSRSWGPIEITDIVGRAFFRYWPPPTMGVIEGLDYGF